MEDWKSYFRVDAKDKIFEARKEFQRYKSTQKIIYLQQACNKLFSAVENLLQVKYNKQATSYQNLRSFVKNKRDTVILIDASELHYFYYNGELRAYRQDVELIYRRVFKGIRGILTWQSKKNQTNFQK